MGTAAAYRRRLCGDQNRLIAALLLLASAVVNVGCGRMISWDVDHASGVMVEEGAVAYYVVDRGDTLYSIAFQVGRDYRELARWNGIGWPYRIYPDQRLRITPQASTESRTVHVPRSSSPPSGNGRASSAAPVRQPRPARKTPTIGTVRLEWQWPTDGALLKTFSRSDPGRKGVDIGGSTGQPVRAAAPGRVVYSGSGLRGYGQLIIVKHNSVYLSAYGHNRRLLVKEGETLRAGQLIAEMGDTEATRPMLHFEIRRNGEPVDPQSLLPKR